MKLTHAATAIVVALGLGILPAYAEGQKRAEKQDTAVERTSADASEQMGDAWITTKVKADLLATDGVTGTAIDVDTENGIVTLNGTLGSQAEVDKAIGVANGIQGVTEVKSNLKVEPPAK